METSNLYLHYDLKRLNNGADEGSHYHTDEIAWGAPMVTEGEYSVWFKTPVGEGAGVVTFGSDGRLTGGDNTFTYVGRWTQSGDRFKATLSAKRTLPGPPGVFGIDEIDIILTGNSDGGDAMNCTGLAKQAPGLTLIVTLIPMGNG